MLIAYDEYSIKMYQYHDNDHWQRFDNIFLSQDHLYECRALIAIELSKNEQVEYSVIIGSYGGWSGLQETKFIIEGNIFTICCGDHVFCLSLPSLSLKWKVRADYVSCFQIFKYLETYIVHGELSISCLNTDGKRLWEFIGVDIFVNNNGKAEFEIVDNKIQLIDFGNKEYTLDVETGKCLS